MNEKIKIVTEHGESVDALAPVIISASRSTDIPAFYAKWFLNRLAKGYCVWHNPFNKKPSYVSFQNTKVIVFWTKDPAPIIPYLDELDKRGLGYYFQVTLNDYEKEGFELGVPTLTKRIETFKKLSKRIGKEKVIWRFDPLILTENVTPRVLLNKIWHVGNAIKGYTDKLVFSFIDVMSYRKVQLNLISEIKFFTKDNIEHAELSESQMNELASGIAKLRDYWRNEGWNLRLATCAEKIDLGKYDIEHNRCIDGELMEELWGEDYELKYYLHTGKFPEKDFFDERPQMPQTRKDLKDKGQRKICGCMVSKDIGMYNTCRHLCVYCYANTSKTTVLNNEDKHADSSESIFE